MKKALCIIFLLIALSTAYSQEDRLKNAFYVELIGNGRGSKKLVDYLELIYLGDDAAYRNNSNLYSFDDDSRVLTVTRSGEDIEGNDTD